MDSITSATSIPLNEYTFETLQTVHRIFEDFDNNVAESRCAERASKGEDLADCGDIKTYIVIVDLDELKDAVKRERLKQLPTSFELNPEDVDELREAAKTILSESKVYKQFLEEMKNNSH